MKITDAIKAVLDAAEVFRSNLHAKWEGDPLSDAIAELRSALAAQSPELMAIRNEWVLVPRELSPKQIKHLQMDTDIGSYICGNWAGAYHCMEEYHAAMIAASPTPPVDPELKLQARWRGDDRLPKEAAVTVMAFDPQDPDVPARMAVWVRHWPEDRDYPVYRSCDLSDIKLDDEEEFYRRIRSAIAGGSVRLAKPTHEA